MTTRLHLLLAAACVLALLQLALGQQRCSHHEVGDRNPNTALPTEIIPAGVRSKNFKLKIPIGCRVYGERATACDYDSKPVVFIPKPPEEVAVFRTGDLRLPAVLNVAVRCGRIKRIDWSDSEVPSWSSKRGFIASPNDQPSEWQSDEGSSEPDSWISPNRQQNQAPGNWPQAQSVVASDW